MRTEKEISRLNSPRPTLEEGMKEFVKGGGNASDFSRAYARQTACTEQLCELTRPLQALGFEVSYAHYNVSCIAEHAQRAVLKLNNQVVGDIKLWYPGYASYPSGWSITTNRHTDPRYSWRTPQKHLKNLNSAIKHIVATAVPVEDIETELAEAKLVERTLREDMNTIRKSQYDVLNGMDGRNSDGFLKKILTLLSQNTPGDDGEAKILLALRTARLKELERDLADAELKFRNFEADVLYPLQLKAHQTLPDLHGVPYKPEGVE